MNIGNRVRKFGPGITLLLTLALAGCSSFPTNLVNPPQVALSQVQLAGLDFNSQSFVLSFDVSNSNPFSLPVKNVAYGIELDGQNFASGETVGDFTVPANGATQFAITVDLNLLQTAPQLLSIVRDAAREEIPYKLEGEFGVNLPLTPAMKFATDGKIQLDTAAR